jgi:tRNA 2-selenouridine synthase
MHYLTWPECLAAKPFTQIIDVRSPGEYSRDRIPGAINLPVLSDAERVEVGTLYVQGTRFAARRLGAAMVTRNVAAHLEQYFEPFPEHSRFLLYCWRGGQRSRAMATILHAVGWNVFVISSGYKGYRAHVREAMEKLGPRIRCHLLSGLTGSGKSRILRAMAAQGRQVLDLESLGAHRGSLLGEEPDASQPSQKYFESLLLQQLQRFDLSQPVWIEGESKRLGKLWIPEPLWQPMLHAQVHEIHVPAPVRAAFLLEEYPHFTADPEALLAKLETLREPCGGRILAEWAAQIRAGEWPAFVQSILRHHYDPGYLRNRKFPAPSQEHTATALDEAAISALAGDIHRGGR